nr:unnamed protein product [Callosobruchus analis]
MTMDVMIAMDNNTRDLNKKSSDSLPLYGFKMPFKAKKDTRMSIRKLLVVGGRDDLKTLNTMECLDLETGTWTQLAPMNTHRHGLGVAVLGGTLYAVGGHDGWSYLNTVER